MKKWQCTVCGYVHEGEEPPDECPVCGADKSQFVLLDADGTPEPEHTPADRTSPSGDTPTDAPKEPPVAASSRFGALGRLLTQMHGHPIAVHIPNGLLPVSVFFTILALLLGSDGFAIAAKYNVIVVALAMPAVIFTGWVDWHNRFGGRMTRVFLVKMVCAGVVTFLSVVVAGWWIVQPNLVTFGLAANGLFLLLNLVNLAAAGVAGWYGGKLVFNK